MILCSRSASVCRVRCSATRTRCSLKPLLAVEPVDAVDAGCFAFVSQQDVKAAIAEATPLIGKLAKAGTQLRVWRPACPIADHLAIGGNEAAGPPLTHLQHATQMSDSISLRSGPTIFLPVAL